MNGIARGEAGTCRRPRPRATVRPVWIVCFLTSGLRDRALAARGSADERDLRGDGHGLDPEVDDLDRPAVVAVGIELLVAAVEALEEGLAERPRLPVGDVDLVGLAEVAAVERALQDDVPRGRSRPRACPGGSASSRARNSASSRRRRDLGIRLHERSRVVLDRVGHQQAEGREDAGVAGHEDRRHAQVGGHLDGVHAARPAEREQGEGARIDAPLDGDDPDGLLHVGVGDGHDAEGRFRGRFADRPGQPRDGGQAPVRMDPHPSAQEEIRIEAARGTRLASVTVGRSPRP